MSFLCKLIGHRFKPSGYVMKEWSTQGKALMNIVDPPERMEVLTCTRCPEKIVRKSGERELTSRV
jgi:hypothetical protein